MLELQGSARWMEIISLIPEKKNLTNYNSRMAGNPHFQQCSTVIRELRPCLFAYYLSLEPSLI